MSPGPLMTHARAHSLKDRVFVAMPLNAGHTDELWEIIEFACKRHHLTAVRANSFVAPRPIIADIRAEIQQAEIIIADLADLNANVLYEVGLGHSETDAVILLARRGQPLPFDLSSMRCIFYDLSTLSGQEALIRELLKALDALKPTHVPTMVIKGKRKRTQSVVADLHKLASYSDQALSTECVWFSGFLSTLAIGDQEQFDADQDDYKRALIEEKDALLNLARRGCVIRCIITPPQKDDLIAERTDTAITRLLTLMNFLRDPTETALGHIDFAISKFRQKNLYIIGHMCVSEGFKTGLGRGYDLTLRQTGSEAISASIAAQSLWFDELRAFTMKSYSEGAHAYPTAPYRGCVIHALQQSLGDLGASARP